MVNKVKGHVTPSLALLIICAIVTGALATTYVLTKPKIDENNVLAENKARNLVLSKASGFKAWNGTLDKDIISCYEDVDGGGVAINAKGNSYGGEMVVMVGISSDGKIEGVEVTGHNDTPGLGSKVGEEAYLKQYIGVDEVNEGSIKEDDNISAISGATISSDSLYLIIQKSMNQFKKWKEASGE